MVVSRHELRLTIHRWKAFSFPMGQDRSIGAAIETSKGAQEDFLVSLYGKRQMCNRVPVPISSLFTPPFESLPFPSPLSLQPLAHRILSLFYGLIAPETSSTVYLP